MRIMFFISVHGHGRGGHFNSLNHVANNISSYHQVGIVAVGPGHSAIISQNSNFLAHIEYNGFNVLSLKKKVDSAVSEFKPDIMHCFDVGVYNIIRLLYSPTQFKIALNRCGGPNPKKFPHIKNLVLFSTENRSWFTANAKYRDSNISLIPNRVSVIKTTPMADVQKPRGFFTFVRIARIGTGYKKSIFDSIALIERLVETEGQRVKLYIIGVIECRDIFYEIQNHKYVADGTIILLTEDKYTNNASKMLYLADAVIGTGRGIMEAASLGLPTLAVNSVGDIPVLITRELFDDAFKTNFSERNVFLEFDHSRNFLELKRLLSDESYYQELSVYMKKMFVTYFDIERAVSLYTTFYRDVTVTDKSNLISDVGFILRTIVSFYKSSRKVK